MEALMKVHEVSGFALSENEIVAIRSALANQVTSWYKCSKGTSQRVVQTPEKTNGKCR